jgi:hypothetical protein
MDLPYRIFKAIELTEKLKVVDIEKEIDSISKIIDALITVQQAVVDAKPKLEDWRSYADSITTKFILHSNSIVTLAKGTYIKSEFLKKEIKLLDTPTMLVIIRAQLECFLMFHFIYTDAKSDKEKEFRYWNWKYDNLLMRSKISPRTTEIREQIKADKIEIDQLKVKISESSFLMTFTKDQRKNILNKGNSKLTYSWDDLIIKAGLNSRIFKGLYPVLSSFAHTGAHSLMNLKDQKLGYTKSHPGCQVFLFLSRIILSIYITEFIKLFKSAEIRYNMFPIEIRTEIDLYKNLGLK